MKKSVILKERVWRQHNLQDFTKKFDAIKLHYFTDLSIFEKKNKTGKSIRYCVDRPHVDRFESFAVTG